MKDLIISFLWMLYNILDFAPKTGEKIIKSVSIPDDIQVLSDTGYHPITHLHKTKKMKGYQLLLIDHDLQPIFADLHQVMTKTGLKNVKDLTVFDEILTDNGYKKVKSVKPTSYYASMYDCTIDSKDHLLYEDGILSHNTITSAIYIAWYICFNIDRNVLILANKGATSKEIMEKIKDVYDRLPYFLKPGVVVNNVNTMYFDNGCKIFAETTTKSSGRGKTVHLLYADEFAFVPDNIAKGFYTSIYPTLSSSKVSQIIITSTPNGPNLFYDLYMGGVDGTNDYKSSRIDWWEVPGRDEAWKQKEIANLGVDGVEKFETEYGLKFFTGSRMLLSEEQIERLKRGQKIFEYKEIPEIHDLGINHEGLIWNPDFDFDFDDKKFVVSVDLSDGNGRDSTVFNFFELKARSKQELESVKNPTQESDFFYLDQIAIFRDNTVSIENAARVFSELLINYFGVERTKAVIEINFKGDYFISRVLNDPKYADDVYDDIFVHTKHTKDSKKKKAGIRIKKDNKNLFCTTFKRLEQLRKIRIYEKTTCEELINFQKTDASYSAEYNYHDDLAMTCVNLCPYLIDFDIDGQPAGEDFLLQVEDMFDEIDESIKSSMQEKIYSTLDSQDDNIFTIGEGIGLFDESFKPEPPANLKFML